MKFLWEARMETEKRLKFEAWFVWQVNLKVIGWHVVQVIEGSL